MPPDQKTGDLVHRFYQEQMQIDGGKMDKFAAISDAAGLTMGYYDATNLPLDKLAQQYTLADNFFHAAFGGSFLNHIWLVCACSPTWPNAPAGSIAQVDANGNMVKDGAVTPDGYAVNTSFTVNSPHPPNITEHAGAGAAADPADDRRPPERERHLVGLVLGRLERRADRASRPAVPVPPSAVRLFPELRRWHRWPQAAPEG